MVESLSILSLIKEITWWCVRFTSSVLQLLISNLLTSPTTDGVYFTLTGQCGKMQNKRDMWSWWSKCSLLQLTEHCTFSSSSWPRQQFYPCDQWSWCADHAHADCKKKKRRNIFILGLSNSVLPFNLFPLHEKKWLERRSIHGTSHSAKRTLLQLWYLLGYRLGYG